MKSKSIAKYTLIALISLTLLSSLLWVGCGTDQNPVDNSMSSLSPNAPENFKRAIAAQERFTEQLMKLNGVVGTGTGVDVNGNPVVKVFTSRPDVKGIPATLDGIPVVIEETGEFTAFGLTEYYRPVPIGVSVGNNLECAAGTIGCVIYINGEKYILSNNHVLARENLAVIGEDIVQPGRYDINCADHLATDKVGDLSDFEPLKFDGTNNYIDAAIAEYSTTDVTCATLPEFYQFPSSAVATAAVGQAIKKVGRTTEFTTGTVSAINVTISVGYTRGTARFVGQIMTTRKFCKAGDSGSLVVLNDGTDRPVGLLFGGTKTGQAILNPIGSVLTRFGASICEN